MRVCCLSLAAVVCLLGVALVHAKPDKAKKDAKSLITEKTQKAIDAGLAYLTKEQHDDGFFGTGAYNGNVAVTSLAGLAFLSGGHHPDQGEYGKVVTKAIRNILSNESKDTPGFLNNPKAGFHGPMYGHGFSVQFLADAYPTIKDKKLKAEVKETLERAVKLIVNTQNDEGGWRYLPRKQDADLSVTAIQVVALRAARDAGIDVPKETFERAIRYVKRCQHPDGGFRYQTAALGISSFARTGAGLTSLNRLGSKDGEVIDKGMDYLRKFDLKGADQALKMHYSYAHYHAAKAMWYAGDKDWEKWYPIVREDLLSRRKDDRRWADSEFMCPHYCTAIALIILQTPHERLPSMKR